MEEMRWMVANPGKEPPRYREVWQCNFESLDVFLRCARQWNITPMGKRFALRYEAVDVVINRMQVADPKQVFEDVCAMEQAALEAFRDG